ncbi:MAG: RNA methyltransferase [Flavobacteriales bacterium]|nr:RNA methyltransferase [Flavobacteriales bacterium]
MLSKNRIKLIRSLKSKKGRDKTNCFIVEGLKSIKELLDSNYHIETLYIRNNIDESDVVDFKDQNLFFIDPHEMKEISNLANPTEALALVSKPETTKLPNSEKLMIALDSVQDPGNLGTIIRTCDWFGINQIFLGNGSVDFYNPKVIQATMGSFTRVKPFKVDLDSFIHEKKQEGVKIIAAHLSGASLLQFQFKSVNSHLLLFGNEGNGLSDHLRDLSDFLIKIPGSEQAESLNIAASMSILTWEAFRSTFNR